MGIGCQQVLRASISSRARKLVPISCCGGRWSWKIGTGFPVGHVRGKCEIFLWSTTGTLPASSKFGEIWGIWGIFSTLRTFCFLRIWLQRFSLYSFFITSMDRTKTPPEHISPDNSYVRERLAFPKFPKFWGIFGEFYPSFGEFWKR